MLVRAKRNIPGPRASKLRKSHDEHASNTTILRISYYVSNPFPCTLISMVTMPWLYVAMMVMLQVATIVLVVLLVLVACSCMVAIEWLYYQAKYMATMVDWL